MHSNLIMIFTGGSQWTKPLIGCRVQKVRKLINSSIKGAHVSFEEIRGPGQVQCTDRGPLKCVPNKMFRFTYLSIN